MVIKMMSHHHPGHPAPKQEVKADQSGFNSLQVCSCGLAPLIHSCLPVSSLSSPLPSYRDTRRQETSQKDVNVKVGTITGTALCVPGLQLQGSLFSTHQERPGNCRAAGLL